MGKLASPSFDTGPSDQVALVDVYNTVDSDTRNNLTSLVSSFGQGLENILGSSKSTLSKLGSQLKNNPIDLAEAKNRVNRALGGSRSEIQYLAESVQNSIFGELTGTDPGTNYVRKASQIADQIRIMTGQGEYLMRDGNFNNVSAVLRFVSDITGSNVFKALDMGAMGALVTGAISTMSAWGIPELVTELLRDQPQQFRYYTVRRSATQIAASGDIDTIEALIESAGAQALTAEVPDFAQQLLSRYVFKTGTTPSDYPARLAQLVKVLTALKYDWFTTMRGSEPVWNLVVIASASPDAKTLLMTNETYKPAMMIAGNYRTQPMLNVAKTMYPYLPLV